MKNFNVTDENVNRISAFNDFLDNLDNDITSPVETLEEELNTNSESISSEPVNVNEQDTNSKQINKNEECTALVVTKPNSLFVAQKMFRKSIKISIKSFLISLSLGFLNLFI